MMRVLFLSLVMTPAVVAAQTVACPETVPGAAIDVKQPPAGWVASSPVVVRLDGGGMVSGDPKQMQYLVPASSKNVRANAVSTWNFDLGEQKWLYCTYGRMAIQLAKRMDDRATRCEVTVRHERQGAISGITAVCR
jgi:hypothetical protein